MAIELSIYQSTCINMETVSKYMYKTLKWFLCCYVAQPFNTFSGLIVLLDVSRNVFFSFVRLVWFGYGGFYGTPAHHWSYSTEDTLEGLNKTEKREKTRGLKHTHTYTDRHASTHTDKQTLTHTYARTQTDTHIQTDTQAHTDKQTLTHIYARTQTDTHIHSVTCTPFGKKYDRKVDDVEITMYQKVRKKNIRFD